MQIFVLLFSFQMYRPAQFESVLVYLQYGALSMLISCCIVGALVVSIYHWYSCIILSFLFIGFPTES